jgi:hypothetical protein
MTEHANKEIMNMNVSTINDTLARMCWWLFDMEKKRPQVQCMGFWWQLR